MSIPILIVEDTDRHYQDLLPYVRHAGKLLGLTEGEAAAHSYIIERAISRTEVKERLASYQDANLVPLVIFDIHNDQELDDLDDLIRMIWTAEQGTWYARMPMIIYSVFVENLGDLPDRSHSYRIRKIPRGNEDIWADLRQAIHTDMKVLAGAGAEELP